MTILSVLRISSNHFQTVSRWLWIFINLRSLHKTTELIKSGLRCPLAKPKIEIFLWEHVPSLPTYCVVLLRITILLPAPPLLQYTLRFPFVIGTSETELQPDKTLTLQMNTVWQIFLQGKIFTEPLKILQIKFSRKRIFKIYLSSFIKCKVRESEMQQRRLPSCAAAVVWLWLRKWASWLAWD